MCGMWNVREQTIPTERLSLVGEVVPTFADRGVSCGQRNESPRSHYYFFQAAPQLYSRGWVDPVPDRLLLRKCGSAGHRTQNLCICSQEFWPLEHRGGLYINMLRFQSFYDIIHSNALMLHTYQMRELLISLVRSHALRYLVLKTGTLSKSVIHRVKIALFHSSKSLPINSWNEI
jgi:hypothetical protein